MHVYMYLRIDVRMH